MFWLLLVFAFGAWALQFRAIQLVQSTLGAIMADAASMKASLVTLGKALDNIAADVAGLKAQVVPGMAQADVDAVQASLDTIATQAQALADSTPDA